MSFFNVGPFRRSQPISSNEGNNPKSPQPSPSEQDLDIQRVASEKMREKSNTQGYLDWCKSAGAGLALKLFVKAVEPNAKQYLLSLLKEGEKEKLIENFDTLAAEIPFTEILKQSLPPEISKGLMYHILSNIAKAAFEGREEEIAGTLTREQLTQEVTLVIFKEIASGLNEVDSRIAQSSGVELTPELIEQCLTSRLLKLFLPKEDENGIISKGEKWLVNSYSKEVSQQITAIYEPLSKWMRGERFDFSAYKSESSNFEKLTPFLERASLYIGNCMANYFKAEDEKYLIELTGEEDIQKLIQSFSPAIRSSIINYIPEEFKAEASSNPQAIENITEAFLLRVISNLAKETFEQKPKPERLNQFIQKVSLHFIGMFNDELKNIPENKPLTKEMFLPLSEKLIGLLLPKTRPLKANDPVALFIEPRRARLADPLAGKIMEIYACLVQRDDTEVYMGRLREVLWDPIALAEKYPNLMIPLKPTIEDSNRVGTEVFVQQIYSACLNITNLVGGFITDIFSNPEAIIAQKEATLGKDTAYPHLMKEISDGASQILKSDDPNFIWMSNKIKTAIQVTLFKGVVHFLEKVDPKDRHPPEKLFFKAFENAAELAVSHLPSLNSAINFLSNPNSEGYIADEALRKEAINRVMEPFVNDLVKLFYEDKDGNTTLEDHLPIPESWGDEPREYVAGKIREALPGLLAPIFLKFTSWIETKEGNRQRLEQQYESPKMGEACRMISAMIPFYLPYLARKNAKEWAALSVEATSDLFVRTDRKKENEDFNQLRDVIERTLKEFGYSDNRAIMSVLAFLENFTEAATLKLFGDFTETLDKMHKASENDPKGTLMVQGTNILLKEVKDHLQLMAKTKSEYKKFKKGKISKQEMMQKFAEAGKLHPALAKGNFSEREKFFKECSQEIFKIGGYSKDSDLPLPQFLKAPLWNFFETKLMPSILSQLFENVTDPDTLNRVMIVIFQQINEASGNVDVALPDEELIKYKDDPQYRMEKISGKLFEALVLMQPSAVTRWLMKSKAVRNMAGKAIAQPLRERLEKSTHPHLSPPLSIILELIENIVPSLHPGFWDEATQKFICEKELADGTRVVIAKPDYSAVCPKTPEEEEKLANKIAREKQLNSIKVVEEMTGAMHNSTQQIFLKTLREIGRSIRRFIDKVIDKVFGKYSPGIKRVVNRFLDFLGRYLIKPLLVLVTYPALYLVKKILRFYFEIQSEMRAKDIYEWRKQHKNTALYGLQKFLKYSEQVASLSREKRPDGFQPKGSSLADSPSSV